MSICSFLPSQIWMLEMREKGNRRLRSLHQSQLAAIALKSCTFDLLFGLLRLYIYNSFQETPTAAHQLYYPLSVCLSIAPLNAPPILERRGSVSFYCCACSKQNAFQRRTLPSALWMSDFTLASPRRCPGGRGSQPGLWSIDQRREWCSELEQGRLRRIPNFG